MPYPNEHASRQTDPKQYHTFRRSHPKHPKQLPSGVAFVYGIKGKGKNRKSEVQSIRFRADRWTPAKARAWLKKNKFKTRLEIATRKTDNPGIPNVLVNLGKCRELVILRGEDEYTYEWSEKNAPILASNPAGNRLFVLQTKNHKSKKINNIQQNEIETAKQTFAAWNAGPAETANYSLVNDTELVRLGKVDHIVYDSPKWQKKDTYIHKFKNKPTIKVDDEDNIKTAIISGKGLRVRSEGIVG